MTKPSPALMRNVAWHFGNLNDLMESRDVPVGDTVCVRENSQIYLAEPSTLSDPHITSEHGRFYSVISDNGAFDVEAWGLPVTEATARKAITDVVKIVEASTTDAQLFTLRCGSKIEIADGLAISASNGGGMRGLNVDFSRAEIIVKSGGTLTAADPAIHMKLWDATIHLPWMDCDKISSGIHTDNCINSNIYGHRIIHQADAGFAYKHSGADSSFFHPDCREWLLTDPEFQVDANFLADGFVADGIDFKVFGGTPSWCRIPLVLTGNANGVEIYDFHPFNGRPAIVAGGPRINPILIESFAAGPCYIYNSYLDNGIIRNHGGNLKINGGRFLELAEACTITGAQMEVICTSSQAGQSPSQLQVSDIRMSVAFRKDDTDTFSWDGDYGGLDLGKMERQGNFVRISRTEYRVFSQAANTEEDLEYYKPGGFIEHKLAVAGSSYKNQYDPSANEERHGAAFFELGSLRLRAAAEPSNTKVGNGQAILWISNSFGHGDTGDLCIKINVGGVFKTSTLINWSAL